MLSRGIRRPVQSAGAYFADGTIAGDCCMSTICTVGARTLPEGCYPGGVVPRLSSPIISKKMNVAVVTCRRQTVCTHPTNSASSITPSPRRWAKIDQLQSGRVILGASLAKGLARAYSSSHVALEAPRHAGSPQLELDRFGTSSPWRGCFAGPLSALPRAASDVDTSSPVFLLKFSAIFNIPLTRNSSDVRIPSVCALSKATWPRVDQSPYKSSTQPRSQSSLRLHTIPQLQPIPTIYTSNDIGYPSLRSV